MSKYTRREDGEGFTVAHGKIFKLSCCDCGLVHDFVIIAEGDDIGIAARRNARATGQLRRYIDFSWLKRIARA